MERFVELMSKNTPYKVYKRVFGMTKGEIIFHSTKLAYYNKFIETRRITLELTEEIRKSKSKKDRDVARAKYKAHLNISRLKLMELLK
jgi:ABC-type uncharacterized transport system ATPase subunit